MKYKILKVMVNATKAGGEKIKLMMSHSQLLQLTTMTTSFFPFLRVKQLPLQSDNGTCLHILPGYTVPLLCI